MHILIRTALVRPGEVRLRVGGGIVWDSEPEREYLEPLTKARGRVLGLLRGPRYVRLEPSPAPVISFFLCVHIFLPAYAPDATSVRRP